jgi:hypothetical protein
MTKPKNDSGSFRGIMKLVNLPNLKDLSGLVKLPSLNTLELNNLSAVESIGGGPFPLLKELNIKKMPHLSECSVIVITNLSDRDGGVSSYQALQNFPCLKVLEIIRCPKLKVKPSFPSSLESLVLANSSMQLLDTPSTSDLLEAATTCSSSSYKGGSAPSSLPLLKILNLCAMTASSSYRWNLLEELVGLQSLEISSSDDLAELPLSMRKLTSLQQLKIWNSVSLQALPGWIGELSSLGRFDIRGCTRLSSLPLFSRTCVACISLSREKESYNTFKAGNPWITPELQRTTPKHKQKLHITKQRACTRGETSVSQGEDIPQRPVTGCHPKERLLKDALKKSHRLSRRSVEGPRISLFPEVPADEEEQGVEASTDLLGKTLS